MKYKAAVIVTDDAKKIQEIKHSLGLISSRRCNGTVYEGKCAKVWFINHTQASRLYEFQRIQACIQFAQERMKRDNKGFGTDKYNVKSLTIIVTKNKTTAYAAYA